jgi:hypothetical protein
MTATSSATSTKTVSRTIFAVTTIVLIAVAAIGYGLYASQVLKPAPATPLARIGVTGGFLNGKVVSFQFYHNFSCTPSLTQLFPGDGNATAAASVTSCEAGKAGTFPGGTIPVWGMAPAFAGLSIFGMTAFGATADGFATWNGTTILTDCTGMGSVHKCPDHPPLFYSPIIVAVENYLGIKSGMTVGSMTLPEGVMPFMAHTHIVETDAGQQDIPWNAIGVFVFDPNIFPDPVTGTCHQVVPSNLTNPTANCLTTTAALKAAMATSDTAVINANTRPYSGSMPNPIWYGLGLNSMPPVQVVVAGATSPSQYNVPNTNVDVPFAVIDTNLYPPYLG